MLFQNYFLTKQYHQSFPDLHTQALFSIHQILLVAGTYSEYDQENMYVNTKNRSCEFPIVEEFYFPPDSFHKVLCRLHPYELDNLEIKLPFF